AGFAAEALPWDAGRLAALEGAAQLVWVALPQQPFVDGRPPADVAELLARHPTAVVVAAREPYCLAHYPRSVLRLAAWGGLPPHLRAVARWLAGELNEIGRIPMGHHTAEG
ncbi:MAG TPA: hypothetical protein VK689_19550, partial [Armatimonadota bacterium]|nr:hypothetical protein [Armatimonadota bacterium]